MPFSVRQHLSLKLALVGLFTTLAIALAAGSTQIYFDYQDRKNNFNKDINKIMDSSSDAAIRAIFTIDELIANAVVEGIITSYPYVLEATIIEYKPQGNGLADEESTLQKAENIPTVIIII